MAVTARQRLGHPAFVAVAVGMAIATVLVRKHTADGVAWAAVQMLLWAIAAIDVATRRIPDRLTLPAAGAVVVLRLLFARHGLPETLAVAAACLAGFLLLAIVSRGGFGVGDAKLAALLGLLLGSDVLAALLVGTLAGAAGSLVAARRARSLKATFAYGPYLCFGASLAILALTPPAIV